MLQASDEGCFVLFMLKAFNSQRTKVSLPIHYKNKNLKHSKHSFKTKSQHFIKKKMFQPEATLCLEPLFLHPGNKNAYLRCILTAMV